MERPDLVLASTSVHRQRLLGRLGLPYTVVAPNVDETPVPAEAPAALVARLARQKAEAVARVRPDAVVIGGDQVGVLDGAILGKPGSVESARAQLLAASGRSVEFLAGLAVRRPHDGGVDVDVVRTAVRFRLLTAREVERYVALDQPLDCAGSFRSEGLGIALFAGIDGEDPTALVGLPLLRLCAMLREAGLDPLG